MVIFVPPQIRIRSGSKGMISARKGTPKDIGGKDRKILRKNKTINKIIIWMLYRKNIKKSFITVNSIYIILII